VAIKHYILWVSSKKAAPTDEIFSRSMIFFSAS
jgi:hypothetical protein